jgi:hypothetical protein
MAEGKESTFNLNRGDTHLYERPVSSIKALSGKLIVSDSTENKALSAGESRTPTGANILVIGVESANVLVTLPERTI